MENTQKFIDLRPYLDHEVISNLKRLIAEHESPSPEMVAEATSWFKNANAFTRMMLFGELVRAHKQQWLHQVHKKVGMMVVEAARCEVPMTDDDKNFFNSWMTRPRDQKVIYSDEDLK